METDFSLLLTKKFFDDMERYIGIEADEKFDSALRSDIAEYIENNDPDSMHGYVDMSDDVEEVRVETIVCELPSLVIVCDIFREAQRTAFNWNFPDASAQLHRALNIFRDAIRD